MNIPEIYFDRVKGIRVSLPVNCSYCEKIQYGDYFLFEKYSKSIAFENKIDIVCKNCLGNSNKEMGAYEYWSGSPVKVVSKLSPSWTLIYFTPPSFKNSKGDFSTWDVADKQFGDEVVVDRTVHSFKNQNAVDSISFEEAQANLKQRDLNLLDSPVDPLDFLKSQQSAERLKLLSKSSNIKTD